MEFQSKFDRTVHVKIHIFYNKYLSIIILILNNLNVNQYHSIPLYFQWFLYQYLEILWIFHKSKYWCDPENYIHFSQKKKIIRFLDIMTT